MKLVLATRNKHKLEEIKAIFNFEGLEISSAFDYPEIPETVEDGKTFESNAGKKAIEIATALKCWALADDSGLEVLALNNAPGVYSARYSGEGATDAKNNEKLLKELSGVEDRSAAFRTVIALSDPDGNVRFVSGRCCGKILTEMRGDAGFGYDPLFVPDGYTETFAELGSVEKNKISHRALALKEAQKSWAEIFESISK